MIHLGRFIIGGILLVAVMFGGFFVMDRKKRTWYHYAGIIGHSLFIIWILFMIQHYPKGILTVIIIASMFLALIGSIIGLTKKEFDITAKAIIRIGLYALIILMLCNYSFRMNGTNLRIPAFIEAQKDSNF